MSRPFSPWALFIFYFFSHMACGIWFPDQGAEPTSPALEAQSLNHWMMREVPSTMMVFMGGLRGGCCSTFSNCSCRPLQPAGFLVLCLIWKKDQVLQPHDKCGKDMPNGRTTSGWSVVTGLLFVNQFSFYLDWTRETDRIGSLIWNLNKIQFPAVFGRDL